MAHSIRLILLFVVVAGCLAIGNRVIELGHTLQQRNTAIMHTLKGE